MDSKKIRKQIPNLVDQKDESKLKDLLNDRKADLEIVGYRASGKVVTLGEVKSACEELLKPKKLKTYSVSEARKKLLSLNRQ
jgi:hypothetical protein